MLVPHPHPITNMMSLWFNLRRSLSQQVERTACSKNKNISAITTIGDSADIKEVFTFPYGTKECVVYKEKGTNKWIMGFQSLQALSYEEITLFSFLADLFNCRGT